LGIPWWGSSSSRIPLKNNSGNNLTSVLFWSLTCRYLPTGSPDFFFCRSAQKRNGFGLWILFLFSIFNFFLSLSRLVYFFLILWEGPPLTFNL
jgi:hypothetical protein